MDELGFLGFIGLGDNLVLRVQCRDENGAPASMDAGSSGISIYGTSDTALLTGTLSASDVDSKTGWRSSTLAITSGNGFASGGRYDGRVAYTTETGANSKVATFSFAVV